MTEFISTPLHEYLDSIGMPWLQPRGVLAERFGVHKHAAYSWNVIHIDTARPFVNGLLWPISTQFFPQFSANVPATLFSGSAYFGDDARDNLRRSVKQLIPVFGAGESTEVSNALGHRWHLDPASVELHVWPQELQRYKSTNPSHDREPRLKSACSITINTGFRLPITSGERALLQSFEPLHQSDELQLKPSPFIFRGPSQADMEYIRQPESEFKNWLGWIGCSKDKSTLMAFGSEFYIVPTADIIKLEVDRLQRAKGPGGSRLTAEIRCNYPGAQSKSLTLCTGPGPDGLNEPAAKVANALSKPLALLPYGSDC